MQSHELSAGREEHLAGMIWAPTTNHSQRGVHAQSYHMYYHAVRTGSFGHYQSDRAAGTLADCPRSAQTTRRALSLSRALGYRGASQTLWSESGSRVGTIGTR